MIRKTLVLLAGGAIAAAITGTALGAGAAEVGPDRNGTAPVAPATVSDDSTARPDDDSTANPGDDSTGRPSDEGTVGPSDDPTAPASAGRNRAIQVALGTTGGGTVVKVESETEHGRAVWSVRIVKDGARLRVDVDAATGQVARSERTTSASGRSDDQSGQSRDDRAGDDKGGHGSDD